MRKFLFTIARSKAMELGVRKVNKDDNPTYSVRFANPLRIVKFKRTIQQKEKRMISKWSKNFILKTFEERLSTLQGSIEHYQGYISNYGKQLHDLLEERRKIETAIYDLKHGTDIPDEEDES